MNYPTLFLVDFHEIDICCVFMIDLHRKKTRWYRSFLINLISADQLYRLYQKAYIVDFPPRKALTIYWERCFYNAGNDHNKLIHVQHV